MDYYYADASGQPAGPVPLDTLTQWIASGNLLPSTQVVAVGESVWQPLASLVMLSYQGADGNAAGPVTLDAVLRLRAAGSLSADSWVLPAGAAQWVPLTSVVPAHFQPQPQAAAPARQTAPVARPGARPAQAARRQAAAPQHAHPHHHVHYGPGGVSRAVFATAAIITNLVSLGLVIWMVYSGLQAARELASTANTEPDISALLMGGPLLMAVAGLGSLVMLVLGCLRVVNVGWPGVFCLFLFVPVVNIYFWVGCLCFPEGYARHRQLDSPARMGLAALGLFLVLAVAGSVLATRAIVPELERMRKEAVERAEKAKADAESEARAEQLRNTLPSGQPN